MRHYSLFNIFQGRATRANMGELWQNFELLQNCKTRFTDFWPPPGFLFWRTGLKFVLRFKNERLKNENTLIANIPWTLSSSFVEIFTRKRPELCKSLDRVKLGQGLMGSGPCLRHNAKRGTTTIYKSSWFCSQSIQLKYLRYLVIKTIPA